MNRPAREFEDAVDWARLHESDFAPVPDANFVMTTSHEAESLDEVLWFAGCSAHHPEVELQSTLLIHLSDSDQGKEMFDRFEAMKD